MDAVKKIRQENAKNNRPKKGDKISVEPIRNPKDVESIKKLLIGFPRDSLLFVMGINNGLRAGDLLQLHVRDVAGLSIGDSLEIVEGKTKKKNVLVINKPIHKALMGFLLTARPDMDDFLFRSRKGTKALSISAVNNLVKRWAKAINLRGNFGAHTLRKTWGYHQRVYHGAGFEVLCKRYNHSSPAITMRYLGIEDKEIHAVLMNEV